MPITSRPSKSYISLPVLGIDSSVPAGFIDDRATPDCQNTRVNRTEVKKMSGYSTLGSTFNSPIHKIISFERNGTEYIVAISSTHLKRYSGSTGWINRTATALAGSNIIPVGATVGQISGQNVLMFCNFVNNIKKFTPGSNIEDLGGSPPIAKYLLWFNGYLLLAHTKSGGTIYQDKLQWSDTDDPESYTEGAASNAGHKYLGEGQKITGLTRLRNIVLISTPNTIWGGYLTADERIFQFDLLEHRLGYEVGNTIQLTPYGTVIGLSKHGLIEFNGTTPQIVAYGVYDDIKEDADPVYIDMAFAVVVAEVNEYWLFLPLTGESGNITRRYRYNYLTKQIYRDTVTNLTMAGLATALDVDVIDSYTGLIDSYTDTYDSQTVRKFFPAVILGDKNGQCYRFDWDELNENGIAIDGYWTSKDYRGQSGYHSIWLGVDVECFGTAGGTLTVSYSTDEGITWTDFPNVITLTTAVKTHTLYFDVFSEKIRLKFRNANANETFTLRGFHLHDPIVGESINL